MSKFYELISVVSVVLAFIAVRNDEAEKAGYLAGIAIASAILAMVRAIRR